MAEMHFASLIASSVARQELATARALGYDDEAAYAKSYHVADETYGTVMSEERPLVTMGLRLIGNFR
jgi:hypothetical protein